MLEDDALNSPVLDTAENAQTGERPSDSEPALAVPEQSGNGETAITPVDPLITPPVLAQAPTATWQVSAVVQKEVCYALAVNNHPIIHSLKVAGVAPSSGAQLTVKISSAWSRAGRPPLLETSFAIDTPALNDSVEISPVTSVKLDHIAMANLEAAENAELIIAVSDGVHESVERFEFKAFARTQWINHREMRVLTAAFVQPQHPNVTDILSAAGDRLEAAGFSRAISGYQQAKTGQHHRIAQAIFEELSSRIDTYINPPHDFSTLGQLLMPLDQVLRERKGTCIDLACAYASCLQRAGLFPVIVFIRGHAFAGYLNEESELNRAYLDSWPEVVNIIDSGLLTPVETVAMPDSLPWEVAVADGKSRLIEIGMEGLLDVARACREGVRPLPAQVIRNGELVVVIDNGPAAPPIVERRDPKTKKLLPDVVPARVQQWKNTLLDLSFRNRLLNLNSMRTGLRLLPPIEYLGQIEDHLANGDPLIVAPSDLLTDVQMGSIPEGKQRIVQNLGDEFLAEAFTKSRVLFSTLESGPFTTRARRMISDARTTEEDSGSNNLYLTVGSVQWGDAYGDFHSPVFLIPLRMVLGRGGRGLTLQADEQQSTVPNYCLIEALRAREQLPLTWFGDDMSDEFGLDVEKGLNELRREFRDRGLDAKGFIVNPSASIAVLDFRKFRLWKDLNDHWQDFAKSPLVKHLIETPRLMFDDPAKAHKVQSVSDTSILAPQPADGSQTRAIVRALAGHSFVLEGPPGTGKSQTITNMLANAMRTGKRVLFVAEKQAALSVVHERLQQVGLGPYCLELHDRGTSPEALRIQLRSALEQNPTLDQRAFELVEQDFAAAASQLDQYRAGLHHPNEAGITFAHAYELLAQLGVGPVAVVPRDAIKGGFERSTEIRASLLELDALASAARVRADHPWMLARSITFEQLDRTKLASTLNSLRSAVTALHDLDEAVNALIASPSTLEELTQLAAFFDVITLCGPAIQAELPQVLAANWNSEIANSLSALETAVAELGREFAGHESVALRTDLHERAEAVRLAANSGFLGLGKKGRVQKQLGDLADVIGHKDSPEIASQRMDTLARLSETIRSTWSSLTAVAAASAFGDQAPLTNDDLANLRQQANNVATAANATASGGRFGDAVRSWIALGRGAPQGVSDPVSILIGNLHILVGLVGANSESIGEWVGDNGVVAAVTRSVEQAWAKDVDDGTYLELQRWLRLQLLLEDLRTAGFHDFNQRIARGEIEGAAAPNAFERGLLITSMQIRAEELNLDIFDRDQHDQRVKRFIDLMTQRRNLAREAIPYELSLSRKVTGNVQVGRVGEFRKTVSTPSRRRNKSIRDLISTFPEIVSDLTPCFLMSPDSVAQFLPPGSVDFDIAVFDEASQITVADAIGVMGRARSVVIVGDSKQMPPTRVGVFGGVDEDAPIELGEDFVEEESILEEVLQAGFDQEWLTWHYRSQDESLITFSNDHYYESRLASFPTPQRLRDGCGLRYHRVDGQFDHGGSRTNAIEAQAIVDALISRLDDPSYAGLTFGVITLNMQQRRLIEGLLDDHAHPGIRELRDTEDPEQRLFVLNLENVQGRERDVIVLGTSFSQRANGTAMPMSFGPLTQRGGEKRLNVAITRARRQMVVVTSFDPEEMRDPSSLGLIHLKSFLERARVLNDHLEDSGTGSISTASHFVGEIAEALRAQGLRVATGYGRSQFKVDLVISDDEHLDEWLVAVLVDGNEWATRALASDRDALPTTILRNVMGWQRVIRVWLAAWRLEPDQIVADLVDAVAAASQARDQAPLPPSEPAPLPPPVSATPVNSLPPKPMPIVQPITPDTSVTYPNTEPFTAYRGPDYSHMKDLLPTLPQPARDALDRLVTAEAPIFLEHALKRVSYLFGVRRLTPKTMATLTPMAAHFRTTDLGLGVVLWPDLRSPNTWRGFRPSTKEEREIFGVCPEELINAMTAIAKVSMGIGTEDLFRATAQEFGTNVMTEKVRQHLGPALSIALQAGRLVNMDDHLVVP